MSVAVHFHPDWPAGRGGPSGGGGPIVLEAMLRDGRYRSQFETGTSNGGLTAHHDGDRWRWESRLFGGRYDAGPAEARPLYGAWDHRGEPHGPAIRFGSAYLRLREEVTARSTFCFPDSSRGPDAVVGPASLDLLARRAAQARGQAGCDELDDYVEAHVHGGLDLARDVAALVLDPCFRGGRVEAAARAVADAGGARVEWHPGFRVATATLPADYRGAGPVVLARRLGAVLTPGIVGAAAATGTHDPQAVKQVWHLLARFGRRGPG